MSSRRPPASSRARRPAPVRRRAPRAALHGEGRLVDVELPAGAAPGTLLERRRDDGEHLLLVEADPELAAWDLGLADGQDLSARLAGRVQQALASRRAWLPPDTTVYRALHDAADGLPGVTVDAYGEVALVQLYGAAWEPHAPALAEALRPHFAALRAVRRARHGGRAQGLDRWFGPPRAEAVVRELGLRYRVRLDDAQLGSGLFADQRAQRRRVRELARGRRVLNLFAYAGGFTVAAAAGGAARVDHVDLSRACLRWAAENLALNGLEPGRHRMLAEDARDWVARATRRGERYELILIDPPAFASGQGVFRVQRDLPALLAACVPLLAEPGLLLACANARGLPLDFIAQCARQAGAESGRRLRVVGAGEQGLDHPYAEAGGPLHHLRALWLDLAPARC